MDDPLLATADALGLDIKPEWREGVVAHLRLALRLGALVMDVTLPDTLDPLPLDRP